MPNRNFITSTPKATEKNTLRKGTLAEINDDTLLDFSCIERPPEEQNRVLYNSGAVQIVTLTDKEYKAILELYTNKNATNATAPTNSPLAPELTMTEKVQRIQDYINSITPNRVDYDNKSPKLNIITKLPQEKPGTAIGRSHKIRISMCPRTGKTILERIDYTNTTLTLANNGSESAAKENINPDAGPSSFNPTVRTGGHMRLRERKQPLAKAPIKKPTTGRKRARNIHPTETLTLSNNVAAVNEHPIENCTPDESIEDILIDFAIKESMNVTMRTPKRNSARERQQPRVDDALTLDDSVIIIGDETNDENRHARDQQLKPIETIDLCSPPNKKSSDDARNDIATIKENQSKECIEKPIPKCPICFEVLKEDVSCTLCGHVFCTPCIRQAIKQSRQCPTCRKVLTLKKIHPLYF